MRDISISPVVASLHSALRVNHAQAGCAVWKLGSQCYVTEKLNTYIFICTSLFLFTRLGITLSNSIPHNNM